MEVSITCWLVQTRDTINNLHMSHGGIDHLLVSSNRQGVIHIRQMAVKRDTINNLHASHGGIDHQLVSSNRQGVILMPINTSYSDYVLQTMY